MPKLEATNPVSGKEMNLLSGKQWLSNVLGVFAMLAIFGLGEKVWAMVRGRAPQIAPTITNPVFTPSAPSPTEDFRTV